MQNRPANSELLTGPIFKQVIRLSVPMIIAFIFVTSYHFVDRLFVSWLGDTATSAIGMSFIVQMIIISIGVGVGSGINSYIARNVGADNKDSAQNAARHAIILSLVIGALLGAIGLLVQRPLYTLLGATPAELELITDYLTIILIFTPLNLLAMLSSSVFQGYGDTMSPMKLLLIGNISNLILDPILIFGWGPIEGMGIQGAAYASAIARGLSMMYVIYKMFLRHMPVRLDLLKFKYSSEIIGGIFQVGLPSTFSQILTSFSMAYVFWLLNDFGADAKAAYTIAFTYEMVIFLPAIGISQAVTILVGQNFGAGNIDRVWKAYHTGIAASVGMMSLSALIILFNPQMFAGWFAQSEAVLDTGATALSITAIGYLFTGIYLCSVASFQGLGLGRHYLLANIIRLYIVLIPATFIGMTLYNLDGIWLGLMATNILSALVLYVWHRFIFKRQIISGEVQAL